MTPDTEEPRTLKRPVEEVASAIYQGRNGPGCVPWAKQHATMKQSYRKDGVAAIACLRDLGFINDIGLQAIKAEEAKEKAIG